VLGSLGAVCDVHVLGSLGAVCDVHVLGSLGAVCDVPTPLEEASLKDGRRLFSHPQSQPQKSSPQSKRQGCRPVHQTRIPLKRSSVSRQAATPTHSPHKRMHCSRSAPCGRRCGCAYTGSCKHSALRMVRWRRLSRGVKHRTPLVAGIATGEGHGIRRGHKTLTESSEGARHGIRRGHKTLTESSEGARHGITREHKTPTESKRGGEALTKSNADASLASDRSRSGVPLRSRLTNRTGRVAEGSAGERGGAAGATSGEPSGASGSRRGLGVKRFCRRRTYLCAHKTTQEVGARNMDTHPRLVRLDHAREHAHSHVPAQALGRARAYPGRARMFVCLFAFEQGPVWRARLRLEQSPRLPGEGQASTKRARAPEHVSTERCAAQRPPGPCPSLVRAKGLPHALPPCRQPAACTAGAVVSHTQERMPSSMQGAPYIHRASLPCTHPYEDTCPQSCICTCICTRQHASVHLPTHPHMHAHTHAQAHAHASVRTPRTQTSTAGTNARSRALPPSAAPTHLRLPLNVLVSRILISASPSPLPRICTPHHSGTLPRRHA